jgi:hypothetical protein
MRRFRRKPQAKQPEHQRPWPVIACGRLLALQGLGFAALAWLEAPPSLQAPFTEIWLPGAFTLLAIFLLANSMAFLRLRPLAWTLGALLQGAALLLALWQYFHGVHGYFLLIMAYGVLMVIYFNHPEVRAAFPQEPLSVEDDRPEEQQ